jgi:hypothetical protein
MEKITKLSLCVLAWLFIASCTKTPELTDQRDSAMAKQSSLQSDSSLTSSSVVSYTKDNTTSVTTIDCTPGYTFTVVYSIGPLTVQAADIVSAHLQRQVNYSGSQHVMTGAAIVVATSPTCASNTQPGYLGMLSPFCGNNLNTPLEGNSEVLSRTGSYKFASASSSVYVNAVLYGASLGEGLNYTLPVGNNYGELVAVVERGVERYSSYTHNLPYGQFWLPPPQKGYFITQMNGTQYVDNSIGPLNIPPYTMVDIRYQIEATAEIVQGGPTQTLGRKTIYTTLATSTSGTNFTNPSQHGITKYERHDVSSHAGGAYFASTGASNAYFNSVVWSYGGSGNELQVESGGSAMASYGHFIVETRPYVYFNQDYTRNVTSLGSTRQVIYSVGPLDIAANQVVEVRYVGTFGAPASITPFNSMIVRATSPTATTGITVQPALYRKYGPAYTYNNAIHSTAERPASAQTGQYYNVVAWLPSGGALPVIDWGELEVVKR